VVESQRIRERLSLLASEPEYEPVKSNTLPLDLIVPDPVQARRPMPELLRMDWLNGADIFDILMDWSEHAAEQIVAAWQIETPGEIVVAPDWRHWIEGEQEPRPVETPEPVAIRWIELLRLASSIYQHGLDRPIAVYPLDNTYYQILSGERRFLAFNLLNWMGYAGYRDIPCEVRDRYDPYRQAVENGVREDLNAIGTSRQLSILLRVANGEHIKPEGNVGQSWYAEAADLTPPYGKGDQIALMLGLPNWRALSRYKALLKLPEPVWNWADEFAWPERKIREMVSKSTDTQHLIRLAQEEVRKELGHDTKQPVSDRERTTKQATQLYRTMQRALKLNEKQIGSIQAEQRKQLVETAQEIIRKFS
jgi:hypothetical protein